MEEHKTDRTLLVYGDCIEYIKSMEDGTIDACISDLPYEHVMGGMKSKLNSGTWHSESYVNTKMSNFGEDKIKEFLDVVIPKMKKVNMFLFCSKLQIKHYMVYCAEHKLKYDVLVWDKSKNGRYGIKSSKFFAQDIEYVIRIYEDGVSLKKVMKDGKVDSTYYLKRQNYEQPHGLHESMKPVELLMKYVRVSTNECDIVLDPFMGSGSTGEACLRLNRNFIGIENNKKYYDIAVNRLSMVCEQQEFDFGG